MNHNFRTKLESILKLSPRAFIKRTDGHYRVKIDSIRIENNNGLSIKFITDGISIRESIEPIRLHPLDTLEISGVNMELDLYVD